MKTSLVFLVIALCATAQQGRQLVHSEGRARRIALVIGNDAYPEKRLHNAVNDARSMKSALEDAGFTVQMRVDATQQQMEAAIDDFTSGANPGDIALFFYAGHGMQINDQNYLIPVDFQAHTAVDAKYKAYPAQRVQEVRIDRQFAAQFPGKGFFQCVFVHLGKPQMLDVHERGRERKNRLLSAEIALAQ